MSTETAVGISKTTTKKSRKSRKDSLLLEATSIITSPSHKTSTTVGVDPLSSVTVKSKKSKLHKVDVGEGETQFDGLQGVEVTKVKKTKQKHGDNEGMGGIEELVGGAETAVIDERKKRKRKRENEPNFDHDDKSAELNVLEEGRAHDSPIENEEIGDSEKKKKRKKERAQDGEYGSSKEKKHKTGNTDLPNPDEDPSLTDQARKALRYAYTQFDDPASWKFNKARQNWLIRNVLSNQIVPELHMPLLTRYLANVKGGIRENLITTCQSILSPTSTTSADPSSELPIDSKEVATDDNTSPKQLRARVVLDALGTKV